MKRQNYHKIHDKYSLSTGKSKRFIETDEVLV
jgi:hypothetical protein